MQINKRKKSEVATRHQTHRKRDYNYNNPLHRSIRKEAFIRDHGKCRSCDKRLNLHTTKGDTDRMAFRDHIIPLRAGGADTLENSQTLCKTCHDKKSVEDKRYYS